MEKDERCVLPTNVKQIGNIGDGSKIYIEDYASTYVQQYAMSEKGREKIAVLVGKSHIIDGEEIIFISGVIQGKYSIHKNGMIELSEKSWQYIDRQMAMYFEGLDVIGWAYIQPGFEDYVNENLLEFQRRSESKGLQVLYLIDPLERINSFYKWHSGEKVLEILKGYMVYFEKNEGMHEYMLENKLKPVEAEDPIGIDRPDPVAKVRELRAQPRTVKNKTKASAEQKKMVNLLGSLSFVMFLVCFIMGAGLIQNDERLNEMEEKMVMMEAALDGTQSVFAAQSGTETTVEETTVGGVSATVETTTAEVTKEETTEKMTEDILKEEGTEEETEQKEAKEDKYTLYTVDDGDTLLKISREHYGDRTRVEDIMEVNDIDDPNRLYIGMELKLPE